MDDLGPSQRAARWQRLALGATTWLCGWAALLLLDSRVDLANLAMVLVLACALATLWLPVAASLACSTASVLAFNWIFVPPRHTFAVELSQHALLLFATLAVTWIVAGVMALQRATAERARRHAAEADQLRRFGDALRDAGDPSACAGLLREALARLVDGEVALLLRPAGAPEAASTLVGRAEGDAYSALMHCAREASAFGPGTGRHAELDAWLLPLRGRSRAHGAARLALPDVPRPDAGVRAQAQALCDQLGLALERAAAAQETAAAHEQAQLQAVRNALLAAISHDYRTPLATMLGAASSLREQAGRLDTEQRARLAQVIVDECEQLGRLTNNTLQLARLDAPGLQLQLDWESAEEIVGAALARARRHAGGERVRARVEPAVPLVRCDALLVAQLLDNLVDNALRYSAPPGPVELEVYLDAGQVVFAVRDRGPGMPEAERERLFEVFQRGEQGARDGTRGAGVGLALCRAVARAHGGELVLRPRRRGGASFECCLPAAEPPRLAAEAAPARAA